MIVDWDTKILGLFSDFSDTDFQRRSWFGIGPEVSDPLEMCCWIDDLDLDGWVAQNKGKLDPHLVEFITCFINDIGALPDDMTSWKVFSSQQWVELRLSASVIRDLLKVYFCKTKV